MVRRMIRAILGQLPAPVTERLAFVSIEHRTAPTDEDRARGAGDTHRGYFYGHPIERPGKYEQTTALPDEEPPRGVIVIFTGKIQPMTLEALARVLLHEIAHVLGFEHDELEELEHV